MATTLFSGTVGHGATQAVAAVSLPAHPFGLAVFVKSSFAATAGTTGVKLQASASLDGVNFSDYADVASTAPTPSSGSPVSSAFFANLDTYIGAQQIQFKLVNKDGTNDATVEFDLAIRR